MIGKPRKMCEKGINKLLLVDILKSIQADIIYVIESIKNHREFYQSRDYFGVKLVDLNRILTELRTLELTLAPLINPQEDAFEVVYLTRDGLECYSGVFIARENFGTEIQRLLPRPLFRSYIFDDAAILPDNSPPEIRRYRFKQIKEGLIFYYELP